ncbi:hypothetical protein BJP40_15785 [Streptomyces sp. CC53]|uniref:hypothetical protein n=1 Tax=Streptomyces sp. CC53 TaxID=1906740 RepID=UPI0008DDB945|nr:hypothetical protein [Streptomyces sp. CC53]OII65788.1 hypothetical protein BJP40_15785 [Streptomyces sp. CC53]
MHALRFAATILWPTIPSAPPPGFRHDSERLLHLAARWREEALELGDFAPARPTLRLITDTKPPSQRGAGPTNLVVTSRTAG